MPRSLGRATATTSATFLPHYEQRGLISRGYRVMFVRNTPLAADFAKAHG